MTNSPDLPRSSPTHCNLCPPSIYHGYPRYSPLPNSTTFRHTANWMSTLKSKREKHRHLVPCTDLRRKNAKPSPSTSTQISNMDTYGDPHPQLVPRSYSFARKQEISDFASTLVASMPSQKRIGFRSHS